MNQQGSFVCYKPTMQTLGGSGTLESQSFKADSPEKVRRSSWLDQNVELYDPHQEVTGVPRAEPLPKFPLPISSYCDDRPTHLASVLTGVIL